MILQALTKYYDALLTQGAISPPGWCDAKASYALHIGDNGELLDVFSLKQPSPDGKREVPQILRVPEQVKKASNIASNFLCCNSSYFLGIDTKGKPARTAKCFTAARALHEAVLANVDSPAARAVLTYFARWEPDKAAAHPALQETLSDILKGANLVFWVNGGYAQQDPAVCAAWEDFRGEEEARCGRCLVTGERAPIAVLHPSIKGVKDARSSGASLVSFNADAFESYGKEQRDKTGQGFNSPVGKRAAFAYGTALNQLLRDREHVQVVGDTTIVYWAEDGEPLCQDLFGAGMFGMPSSQITQNDLNRAIKALAKGKPVKVNDALLNPDNHFYVLGLAPSAARVSVRFFYMDTLGRILTHLHEHHERLRIEPVGLYPPSIWQLLSATVNPNSRDKKASPPMAGAMVRAVLTGGMYPVSLFENTMMRIRAEREVSPRRAAILKAFFLRNRIFSIPEEVLDVKLNEESTYLPYVLGRLFAVLEKIQQDANPGINATIKDKYFNSAMAMPAGIFPLLTKLSQSHLRKLEGPRRIYYERIITDLKGRIGETLPARLSLVEQGAFDLGYYHQVQRLYTKKQKEEKEDAGAD